MEQKKQIKILVVPSDRTGVGTFRSTAPHIALETKYPDLFSVDIDYAPKLDSDKWLSQYDIIHYHRTLGPYEKMEELESRLKNLGIISIMDLDDYWSLPPHHPVYILIKNSNLDAKIKQNLKIAQNVTTTTPIFAREISKMNKNVHVIPNAINTNEKQYQPKPEPSNGRLRIGWLGSSSHLKDLQLLEGLVSKLRSDKLLDKVQFVLCGFDTKGTHTDVDMITKKETTRQIRPEETVWVKYEKIFTDNYTIVSPEYKEFLLNYTQGDYDSSNEHYRRVWTKSITTYANNYNLFDVSLAPLHENIFNEVKSQLKVIEAGFHKKALIAQNFGPYQIDLTSAIKYGGELDFTANSILVDSKRNHKDWYEAVKKLIKNPELVTALQENLYQTVKDTYSMDAVTENRKDLYLKLISEK